MARTIRVYPTYVFRDQDPAVDYVRTAIKENPEMSKAEASDKARLSRSTVDNWISRKTKRPQHATLAAFLGAYGLAFGPPRRKGNR